MAALSVKWHVVQIPCIIEHFPQVNTFLQPVALQPDALRAFHAIAHLSGAPLGTQQDPSSDMCMASHQQQQQPQMNW